MFKLSVFSKVALVVATGVGLAGAAYVATADGSAAAPAVVTAPAVAAPLALVPALPSTAVIARAPSPPARPAASPPAAGAAPGLADGDCGECKGHVIDHDGEQIDQGLVERTGLYRGPSRGPADAPVEIAVFMDLECPYCAAVLGTIDQLWDEYPDQLRLVVKQFPLPFHHGADLAAEASLAADAQGRFWQFHDLALAFQDDLNRGSLIVLAGRAGLDVPAFTRALDQHTYAPAVARDLTAAHELSVEGTPAFFINGRRFTGAQPIEKFRAAIEHALGH